MLRVSCKLYLFVGAALNSLLDFLKSLVKANVPSFGSSRLLEIFLEQDKVASPVKIDSISTSSHKQSYYSLAKCISIISVGSGTQQALNVANNFVTDLSKNSSLTDTQIVIALLSIGEIGRHV